MQGLGLHKLYFVQRLLRPNVSAAAAHHTKYNKIPVGHRHHQHSFLRFSLRIRTSWRPSMDLVTTYARPCVLVRPAPQDSASRAWRLALREQKKAESYKVHFRTGPRSTRGHASRRTVASAAETREFGAMGWAFEDVKTTRQRHSCPPVPPLERLAKQSTK